MGNMVKSKIDNLDNIGDRIRWVRERMGLNQSQFARKLGLSGPSAISKYEKGQRKPLMQHLILISAWGPWSLYWLITGKETTPPAILKEGMPSYPPGIQLYIDKLIIILTGPDREQAGKIEERIDIIYEEIKGRTRKRTKKT